MLDNLVPLLVVLVVLIVLLIYTIIVRIKVFQKAGRKGWKSLIPIYSLGVLYDIVGLPVPLVILGIIPVIGNILSLYTTYRLGVCFTLSKPLALLGAFIPIVTYSIIAFSPSADYFTYADSKPYY